MPSSWVSVQYAHQGQEVPDQPDNSWDPLDFYNWLPTVGLPGSLSYDLFPGQPVTNWIDSNGRENVMLPLGEGMWRTENAPPYSPTMWRPNIMSGWVSGDFPPSLVISSAPVFPSHVEGLPSIGGIRISDVVPHKRAGDGAVMGLKSQWGADADYGYTWVGDSPLPLSFKYELTSYPGLAYEVPVGYQHDLVAYVKPSHPGGTYADGFRFYGAFAGDSSYGYVDLRTTSSVGSSGWASDSALKYGGSLPGQISLRIEAGAGTYDNAGHYMDVFVFVRRRPL